MMEHSKHGKQIIILLYLIIILEGFALIMLWRGLFENSSSGNQLKQEEEQVEEQKEEQEDEPYYAYMSQTLYGDWKIIEMVPPTEDIFPSRYVKINKDGTVTEKNYDRVLNKIITITSAGIEYDGKLHPYSMSPKVYVCDNKKWFSKYYSPESLGLGGDEYFTFVEFYLPDEIREDEYENALYLSDCCLLFIKDHRTMYLSDGVVFFLLEFVI